jgi:hypothetical protein
MEFPMQKRAQPLETDPSLELIPFEIIRNETALSRYPIHNLSTKDGIRVEIKRKDEHGAVLVNWEVSYNSRYGQPGRLAYKIDTIIVNREIDESDKPVPKIIKLGSLRDIASRVNAGAKNTHTVKRALLQNASAFITAKLTYQASDKTDRTLEAAFSRYSVVFTGESLPDGRQADAVYLVLNDIYQEVINNAMTRPLDYDYLQGLSPSEQRFYEILSYQIFPALKYERRARLIYSEYCALSTQVRYMDFDHVKKQMYKLHRPHLRSGYILDVEYESTVDAEGNLDWVMLYTPGAKARNEQLAFRFPAENRRKLKEQARSSSQAAPQTEQPAALLSDVPPLTLELAFESSVSESDNNELAENGSEEEAKQETEELLRLFYTTFHPHGASARPSSRERVQAEVMRNRLGYDQARFVVEFAFQEAQKTKFAIQTFGGILQYESGAVGRFAEQRKKDLKTRREKARQSHEKAYQSHYRSYLGEFLQTHFELALPEAFQAFRAEEERTRRFWKGRAEKPGASERFIALYAKFDDMEVRIDRLLTFVKEHHLQGIPTFWEWDSQHNPVAFLEQGT